MKMGLMMFSVIYCSLNFYVCCQYGKSSTSYYSAFADCLYNSNWICLPIEIQKRFIIMIAYAQKPMFYHGYGIIILNMKTFSKVQSMFIYQLSILEINFIHLF